MTAYGSARRYDALVIGGGFLIGCVLGLATNFDPIGTALGIVVLCPCYVAVLRRLPSGPRR